MLAVPVDVRVHEGIDVLLIELGQRDLIRHVPLSSRVLGKPELGPRITPHALRWPAPYASPATESRRRSRGGGPRRHATAARARHELTARPLSVAVQRRQP